MSGTIEAIDGNAITVNTAQGSLKATIGDETTIQMFTEGAVGDLLQGTRVTVVGQRSEDGSVQARSVIIIPQGADALFSGGFFPGPDRQREDGGTSLPGEGRSTP